MFHRSGNGTNMKEMRLYGYSRGKDSWSFIIRGLMYELHVHPPMIVIVIVHRQERQQHMPGR